MSNKDALYRRLRNLWQQLEAQLGGGAGPNNRPIENIMTNIDTLAAQIQTLPPNARRRAANRTIRGARRLAEVEPWQLNQGFQEKVGKAARRAARTKPRPKRPTTRLIFQPVNGNTNEGSNNWRKESSGPAPARGPKRVSSANSGGARVARRQRQALAAWQPNARSPTATQSASSLRRMLARLNKNTATSPLKRRIKAAKRNLKLTESSKKRPRPQTPVAAPQYFPPMGEASGARRATPSPHARRTRGEERANSAARSRGYTPGRSSNSNNSGFSVGSRGSAKR